MKFDKLNSKVPATDTRPVAYRCHLVRVPLLILNGGTKDGLIATSL